MRINMLGRHIHEGIKNLGRNAWMTLASIGAVSVTLLILGATLLIALTAQQMSDYVAGQLQISAYLKSDVTSSQSQDLLKEVQAIQGVSSVKFVPKDVAFKEMQQRIGSEYNTVLQGFSKNNPLPDEIIVTTKDPYQIHNVSQQISELPGVDQVHDGKAVVDKLMQFLTLVRNIGAVFVAGLIIMAMFLISNTIKITIFSRRREIEIMRLVGATNWFIRWPFLTEGIIIGSVGAFIPFALITYGYYSLYHHFGGSFVALTFPLIATGVVAEKLAIVLIGLGLVIGIWGGIMSVRKFLRV